jgi:ATP-dependent RNA helicase DHX29
LKVAAGTVKGKKKGKANQVVMETPEMVKIKAKIAKVEKEYMFSRKDAGESP